MNKSFELQMIYLVILFLLNASCTNKGASTANAINLNTEKISQHSKNTVNEKLKYTSGIRSILHDSQGNYWLGSHQEGVCVFDGKSFTYFTVEDGLSANQVRTIQEADNGDIWFGTGDGVSSYNGKEIVNHKPKNNSIELEQKKEGNWKLTDNDLWFNAGNESGVYRYDGTKLTYLAFPRQGANSTDNNYGATGFSRAKKNSIWIATYAAAFNYDGESFKIIDDKSLGYSDTRASLHIRSILEDSKGKLWIGNNGIGVLLIEGEKTINFSKEQNLIYRNSSGNGDRSPPGTLQHVFAIAEDAFGNIWFGDRDTGAWKFDGKSMMNYSIDDKLPSQHIWEIYNDRNGELLFAMGDGGVYMFKGNTFERKF